MNDDVQWLIKTVSNQNDVCRMVALIKIGAIEIRETFQLTQICAQLRRSTYEKISDLWVDRLALSV